MQSHIYLYAKKNKHQIASIVNEMTKMDEALKEAKDAYYNDDFVPDDKSYQNQYNQGTDHSVTDNPSENDGDTNVHNQDSEAGTDGDNSVNDDLDVEGDENMNVTHDDIDESNEDAGIIRLFDEARQSVLPTEVAGEYVHNIKLSERRLLENMLKVRIGQDQTFDLVDTGATISVISNNFLNSLNQHYYKEIEPDVKFIMGVDNKIHSVSAKVELTFSMGNQQFNHAFHALHNEH